MFITKQFCKRCKKEFEGTDKDDYCNECAPIIAKEELKKFLVEWRGGLTADERINKIEEWIFHFRNHEHFGPHTPIG